METAPPPEPARRNGYKIRGPETWALIRESYLAGAPAKTLAARYDVTEHALWKRAWREGWTKPGAEAPRPPPLKPLFPKEWTAGVVGAEGRIDPDRIAGGAMAAAAEAMAQGRLEEAAAFARIADLFDRIARRG